MMRMVVVLPEPFGPRKPTISPSATFIDTWSTTVLAPKRLTRPDDLDGVHRIGRYFPAARPTSTICPGCSEASPSGRASIRNTSFCRVSSE